MSKATGRDPRGTSPIARLYKVVVEIVDGARRAMVESGASKPGQPIDIRLPILMAGTDLRVTIDAGPATAVRNAIENAQMHATDEPVTNAVEDARREACHLLAEYAAEVQRGGMMKSDPTRWKNEKDRRFFLRIVAAIRALEANDLYDLTRARRD